mmetsp:Transcript_12547/g.28634  ORF Transcript_12547/g.28634 Transcript_12547/m.28634 type:complete len:244 (-) Transcript_12547:989-1720(-)
MTSRTASSLSSRLRKFTWLSARVALSSLSFFPLRRVNCPNCSLSTASAWALERQNLPFSSSMSISLAVAWSGAPLTISITSSVYSSASSSPSTMCARLSTLSSWNAVLFRIVWKRKSRKQSRASRSVNLWGTVPLPKSARKLPLNDVWRDVFFRRLFCTTVAIASRLSSITTRIPFLSLSSRRSAMPSSFFSLTRDAIRSSSAPLLTWYGSSVTMIAFLFVFFPETCSRCMTDLMTIPPLPVV